MNFSGFTGFIRTLFSWLQQAEHAKELTRLERENMAQREQHERERLLLQLENILTRFENRLPPPPGHS